MKTKVMAFFLVMSCNYDNTKTTTSTDTSNTVPDTPSSQKTSSTPTTQSSSSADTSSASSLYSDAKTKVFAVYCESCHSSTTRSAGGVTLDSYSSAKKHLASIKDTVITEGTMPPRSKLSTAEKDIVSKWLTAEGL